MAIHLPVEAVDPIEIHLVLTGLRPIGLVLELEDGGALGHGGGAGGDGVDPATVGIYREGISGGPDPDQADASS